CFIFLKTSLIQAQGNIHAGNLEIHPLLGIKETYDDNIFLTNITEKDDFITTVTPGIAFRLPKNENLFTLSYLVDLNSFSDYDDQNYQNHVLSGLADIRSPSGLYLTLKDTYLYTSDPANSELTDRQERQTNLGSASLGKLFGERFELALTYDNEVIDYKDVRYREENRDRQAIGTTLYFRVLPKTSLLLEYNYGEINYYDGGYDDSSFNIISTGLRWDATAKISGTIKGGYEWRDYKNEDFIRRNDKDLWVIAGDIQGNLTEQAKLSLLLKRGLIESTFTNNSYFINSRVALKLDQKIGEKFAVLPGGYYEKSEYPEAVVDPLTNNTKDREDDLVGLELELNYQIQEWLKAGLGYKYLSRESNFDSYDYIDNRVFATLSAVL
ncbi:MAG: outer membrane beta-barrel protein, partial [bacterium]